MASYTQEQLSALEAAVAQGVLTVEYGDKKVTYRSLNEMLRLIDMMRKDIGVSSKNGGKKFAQFDKGLN
jgi:hypothetical protein